MSEEREQFIANMMARTGKSQEQVEAFLDVLASGMRRRGIWDGEPLDSDQISERVDVFLDGGETP